MAAHERRVAAYQVRGQRRGCTIHVCVCLVHNMSRRVCYVQALSARLPGRCDVRVSEAGVNGQATRPAIDAQALHIKTLHSEFTQSPGFCVRASAHLPPPEPPAIAACQPTARPATPSACLLHAEGSSVWLCCRRVAGLEAAAPGSHPRHSRCVPGCPHQHRCPARCGTGINRKRWGNWAAAAASWRWPNPSPPFFMPAFSSLAPDPTSPVQQAAAIGHRCTWA